MTDSTHNFNDSPRECLEHYAARRPDSLMGYRPYVENELTRHFVALGALEWRGIDGVKYCKTTPDGRCMLEEYRHAETRTQLDAAHKRIVELEAVCREVVEAFEVKQYYGDVSFSIPYIKGLNTGYTIHVDDESDADKLFTALRHLLDTLPPSE